jgi:hypothetical protein
MTKGVQKVVAKVTEQMVQDMKDLTTSGKIRYLAASGFSTKENLYSGIANYLGIRTQHVRNVLNQPLKKG